MKKLVFFLLAAVALCSCESNDEPCPVTGVELPASSAENPVQPGMPVTIQGQGFTADSEIWLRAVTRAADVQAEVIGQSATEITFVAPEVSGAQTVVLKQNGGEWNLGKLVFPQADKIPLQILPKKVSRIQVTALDTDENESVSTTIRYGYDNEGRIVSIHEHDEEAYNGNVYVEETESAVEYTTDRVTVNWHDEPYNETGSLYYTLTDGRATSGANDESNVSYTYDSNGYIAEEIIAYDDEPYPLAVVYTVVDGSLTELKGIEESKTVAQFTFKNDPAQPNNLNIDLFGLLQDVTNDDFAMCCLLGINGERFRTLPTNVTLKNEEGTETYIYRYTMNGEYISQVEMYEERKGKQKSIYRLEFFYEE